MAKDADGDYYYEAGTVNELFDDIALVEGDGELEVETPDGVSRLAGVASVLGGVRDSSMGTDDLDSGEAAVYVVYGGTGSEYLLEFALHNPDDEAVQTATLASVGSA
jgi:hypothetical protein